MHRAAHDFRLALKTSEMEKFFSGTNNRAQEFYMCRKVLEALIDVLNEFMKRPVYKTSPLMTRTMIEFTVCALKVAVECPLHEDEIIKAIESNLIELKLVKAVKR